MNANKKGKRVTIRARVEKEIKKDLLALGKSMDLCESQMVRRAAKEYLERHAVKV